MASRTGSWMGGHRWERQGGGVWLRAGRKLAVARRQLDRGGGEPAQRREAVAAWPVGIIEAAQGPPSLADAERSPNSEPGRRFANGGHKWRRSWNSGSWDRLSYGRPGSNTTSGRPG